MVLKIVLIMVAAGILSLHIYSSEMKSITIHTHFWWSSYQAGTDLKICEMEYHLICFAVLPNSYAENSLRHSTVYTVI
jgi:hypothetical protein